MKKIYDLKKRLKKMEIKKLNTVLILGLFLVLAQGTFAAVTLTRDLPTSAAAGSTFTVTLAMVLTGTAPAVVGVTENYPSGWTVSNIALGGVAKTGPDRIEWIFWSMGNAVQTQSITYRVTVPSTASGTATFSGTYDTGTATATLGDTSMTITGGTTTTAATTTTTLPPYPAYATRSMSSSVKAGGTITVTLALEIDESSALNAVGVSEVVPAGWTVSAISPNGTYFPSTHTIEWLFWANGNPVADTTISYRLTVPSGTTTGAKTFSGDVDFGGSTNPTTYGRTQITVAKKSSSNNDFTVTLPEQAYANTVVAIVVTDQDSKDPVEKAGVDVFLGTDNNGQKVAYGVTDENGTFKFTPAAAGQYTIYVDLSRYKEAKETLTVKAGTPTTAPTTTVVTTTQKATTMPVTTMPVTTTRIVTTTAPTTTQAPATTQPQQTTTTMEQVTTTTQPTGPSGGSNMLLIGIVVIIIIAAVVFFMMKGKGKGKPAENGKKGKEEKASKPSEAKG